MVADPALSHTVASPGLCGTRKRGRTEAAAPELRRRWSTGRLESTSRKPLASRPGELLRQRRTEQDRFRRSRHTTTLASSARRRDVITFQPFPQVSCSLEQRGPCTSPKRAGRREVWEVRDPIWAIPEHPAVGEGNLYVRKLCHIHA